MEEALGEAMEAGEVVDAVIAQSQTQAKTLWKLREAPAELNTQMHPPINFDVSLPQSEIGKLCRRHSGSIRCALARSPHAVFWPCGRRQSARLHRWRTVRGECEAVEAELYRVVGAFHGSVSAEHGIGLHKKPFLAMSRSPCRAGCHARHQGRAGPLGADEPRQGVLRSASPAPSAGGPQWCKAWAHLCAGMSFLIAARV